ncbi:MAG: DUF3823 domain-containing protein [Segetibacter sp.]|nr:DUF3823 domain-containing protein [Segetibacter sp.]
MKFKTHYIMLLALTTAVISCKKDNYAEPTSNLKGHLVYKGEAIQVEYNQVPFEIYQPGFGKTGPLGVFTNPANTNLNTTTVFAQDGSYSLLLFDGNYKFVVRNGQGPFIWKQTGANTPDTMAITINGSQTLDFEVEPYYMVRNPAITVAGRVVSGSFKAEKIITDTRAKNIETVALYVNKTMFVSKVDNIAVTTVAGSAVTDPNNIKLDVTVPAIVPTQNYVFARIGVKTTGVEDWIFSPVVKLNL